MRFFYPYISVILLKKRMKKFSILFVVLFLVIASCSSDDDGGQVSGNIVGTWLATDLSLAGDIEFEFEGETIKTTVLGEGYDLTSQLTFNESPNTLTSEGTVNMELSISLNGITSTENIEDFEFFDDGVWEVSGNKLIITESGETSEAYILKLTSSELVIRVLETEVESEGGETVTSTFEIVASFSRQ